MQVLSREQPTNATSGLALALTEMFGAARAERFAFASQVPANMTWKLMAGSVLAIGALRLPSEGAGEPAYRADIAPAGHVGGRHRADCRPFRAVERVP
jgi:hypothetical protein